MGDRVADGLDNRRPVLLQQQGYLLLPITVGLADFPPVIEPFQNGSTDFRRIATVWKHHPRPIDGFPPALLRGGFKGGLLIIFLFSKRSWFFTKKRFNRRDRFSI